MVFVSVITIPFDYDLERHGESVVPIYVRGTDDDGEQIYFGWIESVIPIQDRLRALSRRVLGDVWRVSELTEITIHHLWHKYRNNLGHNPSHRIYSTARRKARGIEDPGARIHLGLNLSLDALDEYRKEALVWSGANAENTVGRDLNLQWLEEKIRQLGKHEEVEIYRLLRAGYRWREIGEQLDTNWNTAYRRFARLLHKISSVV
jgi:DNA-directed RNA polymerase specialized sigma24 family protein